jgi:site-specific recombinase XerD
MSRIYSVPGKKGVCWYLDYAVDGRRVRKQVGSSKKLALLALADVQVKIERKELGFQTKDKNLADFFAEYLDYAKTNKTHGSYVRNEIVLRSFKGFAKVERLLAITPQLIESYKKFRSEGGTKPSTINTELNTIKAALNRAVALGYLSRNPCREVKKLKAPRKQVRFLSKEEAKKLLEAGNGRMGPIVETLLYTGLRRDELTHLTWADVDLQRRIVAVQAKDGWHPKDYEVRHIPMAPRLHELFKSLPRKENPWVFSTSNNGPHLGHILSRDFRKLLKHCGIKGASLHTLRHTFASHLVMNGTDVYTVQKLLGHSSIKTTEIYAHLAPDFLKAAVEKLKF